MIKFRVGDKVSVVKCIQGLRGNAFIGRKGTIIEILPESNFLRIKVNINNYPHPILFNEDELYALTERVIFT
jgi:transcription antitermination factor NusG